LVYIDQYHVCPVFNNALDLFMFLLFLKITSRNIKLKVLNIHNWKLLAEVEFNFGQLFCHKNTSFYGLDKVAISTTAFLVLLKPLSVQKNVNTISMNNDLCS